MMCTIPGCAGKAKGRGMCGFHYQRFMRHGDALWTPPIIQAMPCSVDGCTSVAIKRGMCSMHYQRQWKHGDATRERFPSNGGRCSIAGCCNHPRSPSSPYCEMHYYRAHRHGDPNQVRPITGRAVTSEGYVRVHLPTHPVGGSVGWPYEHRVVLWDKIGGGTHPCHWCGREVDWAKTYPAHIDALVVDHLDEVRDNNAPSNLVPACNPCNVARSVTTASLKK